jgi:hypothetical protein
MPETEQRDLFISHASVDAAEAQRLCAQLEAGGLRCWIAPRDIPAGGEYQVEILRGIETARGMVVLLSAAANASPFVKNEVERAFSKQKRLYPVLLQEVKPAAHLELFLSAYQWEPAHRTGLEQAGRHIAAAVQGAAAPGAPAHLPPPPPAARRVPTRALVAAGLAALALVAWFAFRPDPGAITRGDAPAPETPAISGQPMRYFAVVIGINEYATRDGEGWTPLRTARPDAEALATLLEEQYGFTVRRVLDGEATAKGIMVALDELSQLTSRDAALVFFAGHGTYDEHQTEGYWIPADARNLSDGRACREDWVWNSVITKMIEASPARHILVISDSCYSGSLFRGPADTAPGADEYWYRRASAKPSRYLITSGDKEPVLDGQGPHSVFSRELLSYLSQSEKTLFAASEISAAIRQRVAQFTGQMVRGGPLNVTTDQGGEFVFTRKGRAPPQVGDLSIAPPPPTAATRDGRMADALTLAQQGATNSAQRLLGGDSAGAEAWLGQAVHRYLDQDRQAKKAEALRTLLQQIEQNRERQAAQPARAAADFARPRIVACLGPQAGATGSPAQALLFQIALRAALERDPGLRVIEREHLEAVLQELNLGSSALADARAATTIGRLLPASLLLVGDLQSDRTGDTASLRLVDTETSEVLNTLAARRAPTGSVGDAAAGLAVEIAAAVREARPLQARVFERDERRLLAGVGRFHGANTSMVFDVVQRTIREVGGFTDTRERAVGTARVEEMGDLTTDLRPDWREPPPADALLWVREHAP